MWRGCWFGVAWVALVVTAGLLAPSTAAGAVPPPFVAVGHSPTQGTPVPGGYLTADLGSWTSPPESYDFQWLRDGTPIPGATAQDYLVAAADVGHQLQPHVTGHSGADTADFLGTAVVVRKIGATLRLDVRRVHPSPTKRRLVWTAISFMSTERPWATDGGTVTAYKRKDGRLKALGSARSAGVRRSCGCRGSARRTAARRSWSASPAPTWWPPAARRTTSSAAAASSHRNQPGAAAMKASRSSAPGALRDHGEQRARSAAGPRGCTAPPARARPARSR